MAKEFDRPLIKPIQNDQRVRRALAPTGGWNPLTVNQKDNKVARFRCAGCGCLQGIGFRDMQGEFENRCPVCGHIMVFNRPSHKLDGRQQAANRRMLLGSGDVLPMSNPLLADIKRAILEVTKY